MSPEPTNTPVETPDIERPSKELMAKLEGINSATAAGTLSKMGIKNPFIQGPTAWTPGKTIVGPALTLQFMPKREDLYPDQEYTEPEIQLHRHVLYHTQPGDIVVVDARGELSSGVFGEMMLTYFMGRGGIGIVVDGAIRDSANAKELGIGLWLKGVTPNFHTQTVQFPFAVNGPIACGGTLVMPGDIIVADDDGAVSIPIALAEKVADIASEHSEWEEFSKERLEAGGDLRRYYPLKDEARPEYEEWKKAHGK